MYTVGVYIYTSQNIYINLIAVQSVEVTIAQQNETTRILLYSQTATRILGYMYTGMAQVSQTNARVYRHGVDLSKRTVASLLSNSHGGPCFL